MYLETRDLGDMMDIYFAAWERGVKTTYYLHMKPRHTAEQSTVKVNKSEDIGEHGAGRDGRGERRRQRRRGAGHRPAPWLRRTGEVTMDFDTVGGYDVPTDPMDDLQCESCQ